MSFITIDDLRIIEPVPGFKGRFAHSENVTIAFWNITEGSTLPPHEHMHEQNAIVIKGSFELTVAGETRVMKHGDIAVIPSGVLHSAKALTYCEVTDIFFPVRKDYE